jgi:hypothetical protein
MALKEALGPKLFWGILAGEVAIILTILYYALINV